MPTKEQSSVDVGTVKKSVLEFFNDHSKKVVFTAVLLAGAAVAAIGGMWSVYQNYDPSVLAIVNGQKITKANYVEREAKYKKFYENLKDQESLKKIDNITAKKMIEDKIVETESEARGITVAQADVDAEYNEMVKFYGSEEDFKRSAEASYGWTPELTKETIKIKLLKEKLQKEVVRGYDIEGIAIRFDGLNATELREKSLTKIKEVQTELKSGAALGAIYSDLVKNPDFAAPTGTADKRTNLNEVTEKDHFLYRNDYDAIRKAQKAGDVTEIVEVPSQNFAVYRISRIIKDGYATWDDFVNAVKKENNLAANTRSSFFKVFAEALSVQKAYAEDVSCPTNYDRNNTCPTSSTVCIPSTKGGKIYPAYSTSPSACCYPLSTHLSYTKGNVWDYLTQLPVSGFAVTAEFNGGPTGMCVAGYYDNPNYSLKTTKEQLGTATSDFEGHFSIGSAENPTMNCAYHWSYDYSLPAGYKLFYFNFNKYNYDNDPKTEDFKYIKSSDVSLLDDVKIANHTVMDTDFVLLPITPSCTISAPTTVTEGTPYNVTYSTYNSSAAESHTDSGAAIARAIGASKTFAGNTTVGTHTYSMNVYHDYWVHGDWASKRVQIPRGACGPKTVTVVPKAEKLLKCDLITPASGTGDVPLTIRVEFTSNNGSGGPLTDVRFYTGEKNPDGTEFYLNNRQTPLAYQYAAEGTYTPYLSSPSYNSGEKKYCSPRSITVTNPEDPNGGEQPPQ